MRISEVVERSGVPASTLRYYDDIGLVHAARSPNGYRSYDEPALDRLAIVEAAKHLDLTLPQISDLLVVVDGDTCTQVREALHPRLAERLVEVDAQLAALQLLRTRLISATRRVAACPDSGESCHSQCLMLGELRRAGHQRCGTDASGTDRSVLDLTDHST